MHLTKLCKNPERSKGCEVDHVMAFATQAAGVRIEIHVDGKAMWLTLSREDSAKLRG